jgi:hypothetical protein
MPTTPAEYAERDRGPDRDPGRRDRLREPLLELVTGLQDLIDRFGHWQQEINDYLYADGGIDLARTSAMAKIVVECLRLCGDKPLHQHVADLRRGGKPLEEHAEDVRAGKGARRAR